MGVGGREGRERDGEGLAQSESEDGSDRHTHSEYHTASTTQRVRHSDTPRTLQPPHTQPPQHGCVVLLLTCRPRPFPYAAPSMIPGRSNSWILHPLWYRFPGMAVSVVNSYPAASDLVSVSLERREDLPTLGKPMRDTRPSPDRATSNPRLPSPIAPPPPPPPPPPLLPLLSSCRGSGRRGM